MVKLFNQADWFRSNKLKQLYQGVHPPVQGILLFNERKVFALLMSSFPSLLYSAGLNRNQNMEFTLSEHKIRMGFGN
jgi:hypothetical protein